MSIPTTPGGPEGTGDPRGDDTPETSVPQPGDPYGAGPYDTGGGYGYRAQTAPAPQLRNGFGITGLVLGILSVVLFWCFGVPGLLCAVPGLVFGILGIRRAQRGEATMGFAVTGVTLSAIGLVLSALVTVFAVWLFSNMSECLNPYRYPTPAATDRCIEENLFTG